MIKLTDRIKAKLNNPEIIHGMASEILLNHGQPKHFFEEDHCTIFEIPYSFRDFPNNKLELIGKLNLDYLREDSDYNHDIYGYLTMTSGNDLNKGDRNFEVINKYYEIFTKSQKYFSSIKIRFNKNDFDLNVSDLENLDREKIKPSLKYVFGDSFGKVNEFKKGPWQEYLAKIYLNVLGFDRIDGQDNLLLED